MMTKAAGFLTSMREASSSPASQRKHPALPGCFSLAIYSILQGAHILFISIPQKHIVFPIFGERRDAEVEKEHVEAARMGRPLPWEHIHLLRQPVPLFEVAANARSRYV